MGKYKKIEKAFKDYYSQLLLFANKYLNDIDEAKDLVQGVFINILEKDFSIEIRDYKHYLYTSVKNRCINKIKADKQFTENKIKKSNDCEYFDPLEAAEFEYKIFTLIKKLPPATNNIFIKSRFNGLSNQEIADELNISKRTVELQISNALSFLRKKLFK